MAQDREITKVEATVIFTEAYAAAMFFTDGSDEDALAGKSRTDFSEEAAAQLVDDCATFLEQADHLLDGKYETAGHDFWYTRNGHGCGFWDGDWPEHGDELTALCKTFKEVEPYVGDDGKIYFC